MQNAQIGVYYWLGGFLDAVPPQHNPPGFFHERTSCPRIHYFIQIAQRGKHCPVPLVVLSRRGNCRSLSARTVRSLSFPFSLGAESIVPFSLGAESIVLSVPVLSRRGELFRSLSARRALSRSLSARRALFRSVPVLSRRGEHCRAFRSLSARRALSRSLSLFLSCCVKIGRGEYLFLFLRLVQFLRTADFTCSF